MKRLPELSAMKNEFDTKYIDFLNQIKKIVKKELGNEWNVNIILNDNTISIFRIKDQDSIKIYYERIIIEDKEYQTNFDDKDNLGEKIFNKIKHLL